MFYLADKIQTPLKSVIWMCAGFVIIIAFIKNSGVILTLFNLSSGAVEELSTIGSDSLVGLLFLDNQYLRMYRLANTLRDKGNVFTGA